MNQISRFDLAALNRMYIGFDVLEKRVLTQEQSNYPPYNVIKVSETNYAIEIAVAGFLKEEISVELANEQLVVRGERNREDDETTVYLYRGLGSRNFVRNFPIADHLIVKGATISNGILRVDLERIIPESLKPRSIDIVELK